MRGQMREQGTSYLTDGRPQGHLSSCNLSYKAFAMEYFTHLPEFQVIVCKECQHALLPIHIGVHFAAKPQHALRRHSIVAFHNMWAFEG
jgi:hypothetical protein